MGQPASFFIEGFSAAQNRNFSYKNFPEEVQRHLKSLRLNEGEKFFVVDGHGARFELHKVAGGEYRVVERVIQSALLPKINLILAPPKGDLLSLAVAQAVEIGVSQLWFYDGDFVQAKSRILDDAGFAQRARRVAAAACEQCSRSWALTVHEKWMSSHQLETLSCNLTVEAPIYWANEDYVTRPQIGPENFRQHVPEELYLLVGPEGGWSEKEKDFFKSLSFQGLGLGSLVLRVPTAIVAAVTYFRGAYWNARA